MDYSQADRAYPLPRKIASVRNIEAAWNASRDSTGRGGASGIDNITPQQFRQRLETNFLTLRTKLVTGQYFFSKLKPYLIAKEGGGFRVICVPTVEDRLTQRLILRNLTQVNGVERDRLGIATGVSYGIRNGSDHGVHSAIRKALKYRAEHGWVLKTDISKFFDTIPRERLKNLVRARLKTSSTVPLIEKAIDCELQARDADDENKIEKSGIKRGLGLRQGMPLSPLLSNLILSGFDRKIVKKKIRMIRYADDLIAFGDSKEECEQILNFVEVELRKLELRIPTLEEVTKTVIKNPKESVIFLGVELYRQPSGKYAQKIPEETCEDGLRKIRNHGNFSWNIAQKYSYADVVSRLDNILDGYESAFSDCTNLQTFITTLRQESGEVKKVLVTGIFGEETYNILSSEQRAFLGFP